MMTTEPQIAEDVTRPEKKDVQIVKVLVDKAKGTVKWYNVKRLYGFINREDNNEDVFVHRSAIKGTNRQKPSLRNGEEVEFSVVETTQGVEAANVTGPDAANVLGFRSRRNRRFGRGGKGAGPDGDKLNNHHHHGNNENGDGDNNNSGGEQAEHGENGGNEAADGPGGKGKKRRRPRRRRPVANGEASEIETYYEAVEAENGGSPNVVGDQRRSARPPPPPSSNRRGRPGRRNFNQTTSNRFQGELEGEDSVPGEPRPYSRGGGGGGMSNGLKGRGRGGRRGRGGYVANGHGNGNGNGNSHSDQYVAHDLQS